jgi:uncharacterized protein
MTDSQIERAGGIRRASRLRYLIDIVPLVAVTFLLDAVVGAFVRAPVSLQTGFVFDAIGKMLLVGVAWGLIRFRGETLTDIGLKRPASWMRTFMIGIGLAAIIFTVIYFSEKAGFRRDLSKFKDVQGNLELTVFGVFYAFIGAGFYEEFMFRGFLFQGLAMPFGASRGAWIAACIVQGALFGAAHAYQNPLGIVITGMLGVVMGIVCSRIRPKSLAGDHRPRHLRREPLRFVLFPRPATRLTKSIGRLRVWCIRCRAGINVDIRRATPHNPPENERVTKRARFNAARLDWVPGFRTSRST